MHLTREPVCDVRLPPEEVSRILDELDARECAVAACRRRSVRHPLRGLAVALLICAENTPEVAIRVRLRNVSKHGVAFLSGRPIPPGVRLRIGLPIGPGGQPVDKQAVVRRCRFVEGGVHEIGAEFCGGSETTGSSHPGGWDVYVR